MQTGSAGVLHSWSSLGVSADGPEGRIQGATPGAQAAVQEAVQKATGREVLIHFSVRDTGIGISQPNISRLFQSFSQVISPTHLSTCCIAHQAKPGRPRPCCSATRAAVCQSARQP